MRRPEAIAYDEIGINLKTEVIKLDGDPAGGLAIKKGSGLNGCGAATHEVGDQEVSGDAGLDEAFDEKHVLSGDLDFGEVEDFASIGWVVGEVMNIGGDELTDDRQFHLANEIRHENKGIFEDADDIEPLAGEIGADLPGQFGNAPFNLVGGYDDFQVFR